MKMFWFLFQVSVFLFLLFYFISKYRFWVHSKISILREFHTNCLISGMEWARLDQSKSWIRVNLADKLMNYSNHLNFPFISSIFRLEANSKQEPTIIKRNFDCWIDPITFKACIFKSLLQCRLWIFWKFTLHCIGVSFTLNIGPRVVLPSL